LVFEVFAVWPESRGGSMSGFVAGGDGPGEKMLVVVRIAILPILGRMELNE
jgi:hypothetical protein